MAAETLVWTFLAVLHTIHGTLYVHCILRTIYCKLHTDNYILHTTQCTLYTAHYILHTKHCRLYTTNYTLHTIHCTLYTAQCTLHTAHFILYAIYSILNIKYNVYPILQTIYCTIHTAHITLHTKYQTYCNLKITTTLYAVQCTLDSAHWINDNFLIPLQSRRYSLLHWLISRRKIVCLI